MMKKKLVKHLISFNVLCFLFASNCTATISTQKPKIYLANSYGFSEQQKKVLLPQFIEKLQGMGFEVWEPFQRTSAIDFSQSGWAYEVAQKDLQDVTNCDAIFAIVNGTPPDEGVMIELGAAFALKKTVFLFRDDFRKSTDSEEYPLNLMVFAGLPKATWKNYYYTNLEDISNPKKALYQFAKQKTGSKT